MKMQQLVHSLLVGPFFVLVAAITDGGTTTPYLEGRSEGFFVAAGQRSSFAFHPITFRWKKFIELDGSGCELKSKCQSDFLTQGLVTRRATANGEKLQVTVPHSNHCDDFAGFLPNTTLVLRVRTPTTVAGMVLPHSHSIAVDFLTPAAGAVALSCPDCPAPGSGAILIELTVSSDSGFSKCDASSVVYNTPASIGATSVEVLARLEVDRLCSDQPIDKVPEPTPELALEPGANGHGGSAACESLPCAACLNMHAVDGAGMCHSDYGHGTKAKCVKKNNYIWCGDDDDSTDDTDDDNHNYEYRHINTAEVIHPTPINDNVRCGVDWNDANSRCGTPCPNNVDSDCPGAEQCFRCAGGTVVALHVIGLTNHRSNCLPNCLRQGPRQARPG
jgi:hypothetical protein